jgi:hypothetical protein
MIIEVEDLVALRKVIELLDNGAKELKIEKYKELWKSTSHQLKIIRYQIHQYDRIS